MEECQGLSCLFFFSVYMFFVSRAHVAKRVIRGLQATRKTDVVARNVELSISGIIAVKRDTFCLSYSRIQR